MRNTPKSLNEELNRMKKLMTFDISENSHDVLSEQDYSNVHTGKKTKKKKTMDTTVPNWGEKSRGKLNFGALSGNYAKVKNNDMFGSETPKQMFIISSSSSAPKLMGIAPPPDEPPVPEEKVANIEINFSMEDSFKLDKVTLTSDGEVSYNTFIDVYNDTKKENSDIWDDYLSSIKKGEIEILGYASQDGDPNKSDGGYLSACSTFGVGVGPKNKYNLCLSQQRANAIRDKIINDIPELSGLLTAKGMGETCNFGPCWSNDSGVTTTDTAPNRRVVIKFPEYKTTSVEITEPTNNTDDSGSTTTTDWDSVTTYITVSGKDYKAVSGKRGLILENITELMDDLGKKIPIFGNIKLNGKQFGKGIISKDGIKVKSGGGVYKFNNWNDPSVESVGEQSDKLHFKQTDKVLSIESRSKELVYKYFTLGKIETIYRDMVNGN
jgi:outer membrane protein OmpA-like peptidoglycan-associated protein